MPVSEARKRATAKYDKLNTKSVQIKFILTNKKEKAILEHLSKEENKNGLVKKLLAEHYKIED